jgi:Secretion system C-terminal sorting domain/FG-GAP-like repeat
MKKVLLFCVAVLLPLICLCQAKFYQPDASIKVYAYGQERTLAWCGGFNTPTFSIADLNRDGLPDLVVYERGNSLRTFINVGSVGNPSFVYNASFERNFPAIKNYLVLADYDKDGVPDLFHRGDDGFAVYRGYYNAENELCFSFYRNLWYPSGSVMLNAYTNPGETPAIVDVDGDGDLDFIAFNITGGSVNCYLNMQVENHLPNDSISVVLADQCWGKFFQVYERKHQLANDTAVTSICMGARPRSSDTARRPTDGSNALCLFDWDGDGDYDYLDGNAYYSEMTFLQNGRIPLNPSGADSMVGQDTMFQSTLITYATSSLTQPLSGRQIEIRTYPAASNVDVDDDGNKDLLISPNYFNTENYKCVWFYKNYTTPGNPDWRFQSDTFLIDRTIDLGSSAYPALFDYDKDGKPDLIVGSAGYFQASTGTMRSRLSYYNNTSASGSPSLTLQTTDFLNIDSFGFAGAAPAFGDIDGDGISDMVIGHTNGTLSYFKNMATSESVVPDWQLSQLVLTDENGDTINTGGYAAPFIYDLDKDGKKDLLIGNYDGYLEYYRNVATTPGSIKLELVNTDIGGVDVDPTRFFGKYSTPFVGPIDATDSDYLMLGSGSGNIYRYTGFQSGDTTASYAMLDAQYSYIDSAYLIYNEGGYGVNDLLQSSVAVGHLAADSNWYMVVGLSTGGLKLFKWEKPVVLSTGGVQSGSGSMKVYPNPANDVLNVSWYGLALQQTVQISIVNMEGQAFYSATVPAAAAHTTISTSGLPPGMYVCVLQQDGSRSYSKFTVVK